MSKQRTTQLSTLVPSLSGFGLAASHACFGGGSDKATSKPLQDSMEMGRAATIANVFLAGRHIHAHIDVTGT
jgi:hypothetical protein